MSQSIPCFCAQPESRLARRSRFTARRPVRQLLAFTLLLCGSVLLAVGDSPYINGHFQPSVSRNNWAPADWVVNSFGRTLDPKNFDFQYSTPDADGNRIMTVTIPRNAPLCAIYGANRLIFPVVEGDRLTYTGEAMGTGELQVGFYGYKMMKQEVTFLQKVPLQPQWTPFRVTQQVRDGSGDGSCYIRSAMMFAPGSRISIRKLRLERVHMDPAAVARRGFRYYPVYRLEVPLTMDLDRDRDAWAKIPVARGFAVHRTNQWQDETVQSSFQMAHDGRRLYLLVHCLEPDTDYIRFTEEAIDKPLNNVEFGVSSRRGPQGTAHAWYQVDSRGKLRMSNTSQAESEVTTSVRKTADGWQVQLAMGMPALLMDREPVQFGKDYYFNVGRTDAHPKGRRLSSFAPSGFGTPDNFTVMTLFDRAPDAADAAQDRVVNAPYYEYLWEAIRELAGREEADWKNRYGKYGTAFGANLNRALALSKEAAKTLEPGQRDWRKRREVLLHFRTLEQRLTSPIYQVRMKINGVSRVERFLVNGVEVPLAEDGRIAFDIQQGGNVLAAVLKDGHGKVNLKLEKHPETLGHWRWTPTVPPGDEWLTPDFDDRSWPMVEAQADGAFDAGGGCVRQILFWEMGCHGDYRLTIPHRCYGFSRNGYEQMMLFLDSPLAFPLDDFSVTWELPVDLQILNRDMPLYTSVREVPLASRPGYHCYVMNYRKGTAKVGESKIRKDNLLFKLGDRMLAGAEFKIGYHRAAGNFVEMRQELPCRVLPEVNGRIPRNILLTPGMHGPEPPHARHEFCRQFQRAGMNAFNYYEVERSFIEEPNQRQATFQFNTCYPMDGAGWGIKGALFELVKNTPRAQAHFFDESVEWGGRAPKGMPSYMHRRETTRFCQTWACQEGRRDFVRCVRADVRTMLRHCPEARIFWNNWERHVGFGKLERCFCPHCLAQFAKRLKLPPQVKLTRQDVKNKYSGEWIRFQYELDAQILGMVTEAVQGLGMQFMAYNGTTNHEAWKAVHGKMLFNLGCPGSGLVTSRNQKLLDHTAAFFDRECDGVRVAIGQIILPNVGWGGGRFDYTVDPQGFCNPELLKNALVRQTAALHGGTRLDACLSGGMLYYVGEASRLIASYEPLFHRGVRQDKLASSPQIAYPDLLVLTREMNRRGDVERLVLLFNEHWKPKNITLENLELGPKATVRVWEGALPAGATPQKLQLTIPPRDVLAVHIMDCRK